MTTSQLVGYSHAFLVAATDHAKAAKENGRYGEVDGMMCIIALQNSVVGATQLLGADHPAVSQCLEQTPDLKAMRDMLTHFDEYSLGTGRLQRGQRGAEPIMDGFGWLPLWNTDGTMLILSRRNGEETPVSYEVSIHEALKPVAVLVTVAFESKGADPQPTARRVGRSSGVKVSAQANRARRVLGDARRKTCR